MSEKHNWMPLWLRRLRKIVRQRLRALKGEAKTPLHYSNGLFDLGSFWRHPREECEKAIRSLCNFAPLGEGEGIARVLGRYPMFIDTRDDGLSTHLILDGFWETWVTETVISFVRRDMVVADIGANMGYFSILMADLVGPNGKVHAFEPNPRLAQRIRRSVKLNGFEDRCEVHCLPLGARNGEKVIFYAPERDPKNGYILPVALPFDRAAMPQGAQLMLTTRLDSRPDWNEIELAKIDVEGAEELIWEGAEGLLAGARLHTIILEFTPARYADAGAFLDRILAAGFDPYLIQLAGGIIPVTREAILGANQNLDQMLMLVRGQARPG